MPVLWFFRSGPELLTDLCADWGTDAPVLIERLRASTSQIPLASSVRPIHLGSTVAGVLSPTLPRGLRNGAREVVQLLFRGGHLCNPLEDSPVTKELLLCLDVCTPTSNRAASLINASGAGKTHALLCALQVCHHSWLSRYCTKYVLCAVQKHYGILLDMGQEAVFGLITDHPHAETSEERTEHAVKTTAAIALSRLLGLYLQFLVCQHLTPEAWLWFQCSESSVVFFLELLDAVTEVLESLPVMLFARRLGLSLLRKCGSISIIGAVDEAQRIAAVPGYSNSWVHLFVFVSCRGLCCSPDFVEQITAPVGGAGGLAPAERPLLSSVVHALSMVLPKLVISGTALSLYHVTTVTSSLYKSPTQADWGVFRIVNTFQPWSRKDFQSALSNCLAVPATVSSHMLPPTCFPGTFHVLFVLLWLA